MTSLSLNNSNSEHNNEIVIREHLENRYKKVQVATGIIFIVSILALVTIYFYANPFAAGFVLSPHLVLFVAPASTSTLSLITFVVSLCTEKKPRIVFEIPKVKIKTESKPRLPIDEIVEEGSLSASLQSLPDDHESLASSNSSAKSEQQNPLSKSLDIFEPINSNTGSTTVPTAETEDLQTLIPVTTTVVTTSVETPVETLDTAFAKVIDPVLNSVKRFFVSLTKCDYYKEGYADSAYINGRCSQIETIVGSLRTLFYNALDSTYFIPKRLVSIILNEESVTRIRRRLVTAQNAGKLDEVKELITQLEEINRVNDLSDVKKALIQFKAKENKTEQDYQDFYGQLIGLIKTHLAREFSLPEDDDIVYQSHLKMLDLLLKFDNKSAIKAQIDALADKAQIDALADKAQIDALADKATKNENLREPLQKLLQFIFEDCYKNNNEEFASLSKDVLNKTLLSSMNTKSQAKGVQKLFSFFMELISRNLGLLTLYFEKDDLEYKMYENFVSSESFDLIQDNPEFHQQLFKAQFNINKKLSSNQRIALVHMADPTIRKKMEDLRASAKKDRQNALSIKKELCDILFQNPAIRVCYGLKEDSSEKDQLLALDEFLGCQRSYTDSEEIQRVESTNNCVLFAVPCAVSTHPLYQLKNISGLKFNAGRTLLYVRDKCLSLIKSLEVSKELLEAKLYNFPGFSSDDDALYRKTLDDLLTSELIYPIYDLLLCKNKAFKVEFVKVMKAHFKDIEKEFMALANDPDLDLMKLKVALAGEDAPSKPDPLAPEPKKGLFNFLAEKFEKTYQT